MDYKIFNTTEEYNAYTSNGTNMVSGLMYFVREDNSTHFKTNNIDSTLETFNSVDGAVLSNLIDRSLTSINIPTNIDTIGGEIFHATGLESVNIPRNIEVIDYWAFAECEALESVVFSPDSDLNQIKVKAFYDCVSLTEITLPSTLTAIGVDAFAECGNLDSVTILATTPPTLGNSNAFNSEPTIYVPADSVDAYKAATNWSKLVYCIEAIPTEE